MHITEQREQPRRWLLRVEDSEDNRSASTRLKEYGASFATAKAPKKWTGEKIYIKKIRAGSRGPLLAAELSPRRSCSPRPSPQYSPSVERVSLEKERDEGWYSTWASPGAQRAGENQQTRLRRVASQGSPERSPSSHRSMHVLLELSRSWGNTILPRNDREDNCWLVTSLVVVQEDRKPSLLNLRFYISWSCLWRLPKKPTCDSQVQLPDLRRETLWGSARLRRLWRMLSPTHFFFFFVSKTGFIYRTGHYFHHSFVILISRILHPMNFLPKKILQKNRFPCCSLDMLPS
jgi:hypothetical protein